MKPNEIVEDFTKQRDASLEEIKKLEAELNRQKELFLKLQGALEGITRKKNVTALDTGCVWGKRLSALRLEDNRIFACNKIN